MRDMTALLMAAALGLGGFQLVDPQTDLALAPIDLVGAGGDASTMHPAALVASELGVGLAAGLLSMPAVYFVSWIFGGFGLVPVLDLVTMVVGTLVLPPAAVAGAVWAIADLSPHYEPRFRPTVGAAMVAWAAVTVAGSFWYEGFWNFVLLTPQDSIFNPLAALPYLLLGSAVLAVVSTVTVNVTRLRRTRDNYWRRPTFDEEPEDPFAASRPPPDRQTKAPSGVTVPLWAGRF